MRWRDAIALAGRGLRRRPGRVALTVLAVGLASPERHPSAKAAKDVAAACVLLGAITSVVVGLLLFASRLVSRLSGT